MVVQHESMKVTRSVVWWRGVAPAPAGELRLRREKRPRVAVEFACNSPFTPHMSGSGRASPRASAWVHTRSLAVSFGIYQRIGGERVGEFRAQLGFPTIAFLGACFFLHMSRKAWMAMAVYARILQ